MKKLESLSIVIPCYNEINTLQNVIDEVFDVASKITTKFELIIINDGSNDGTYEFLNNINIIKFKIILINRIKNHGIGQSLIEGFSIAKYKYVFFNSADQQAPMKYLNILSDDIYDYDIVIASYPDRKDPIIRKILSNCYHLLIKVLFKVDVKNVNAMKLFDRKVFDKNFSYKNDHAFDFHFLLRAVKNKYTFTQKSFVHFPRHESNSSINWLRSSLKTMKSLIEIYFEK